MSSLPELLLSEEQEMCIQAMRSEVEQYIYGGRFGRRQETLQKLDTDDMELDEPADDEFGEEADKASEHGDLSEAQEASLGIPFLSSEGKGCRLDMHDPESGLAMTPEEVNE